METQKKYCMCCDEEVTYHSIRREGNRETACDYCGFVLDMMHDDGESKANCIVTADDSGLIRELLESQLRSGGTAKEIHALADGQQAVSVITKRFAEGKPVDCVILDLDMPVMNGISAARVIRSLEERFHITPPTPLIFFSSLPCNEEMKKKLSSFSPASYINKGSGKKPEQLLKRIKQLVAFLLKKRKSGKT